METTDQRNTQIVDLFQESAYTLEFLKKNIEDIVAGLSKQFKEPEDSYRELTQNCLDAETKQIDVSTSSKKINKTQSMFTVTFEDYGIGMNARDREEFFLKLFSSSKEHDPRKIGKYGIGISSIFALGLEEIVVSSSRNAASGEIESWEFQIKDISSSPKYTPPYEIEERKGTKISLTRIVDTKDIPKHKAKVLSKVSYYCERHRTPIYIDKKFINKEFDLGSAIKISQNRSELEYVLSIGEKGGTFFELFNNRLKLQDGKGLFEDFKMVSCLISSPYFKHTFSRDSVVDNSAYKNAVNEAEKAIKGLFIKSLEVIEHYNNTPVPSLNSQEPVIRVKHFESKRFLGKYSKEQGSRWTDEVNIRNLQLLRNSVEFAKEYPDLSTFTENLDEIEKKIEGLIERQDSYSKKREEYFLSREKRSRELGAAWDFVELWLKNAGSRVDKKEYSGVRTWFTSNNFYDCLKKTLPLATAKYKIIQTLDGDFSIPEILDVLKKEGHLYYISSRNKRLEELIKKDGKILFLDPFNSDSSLNQKKIIELIASKNDNEKSENRYVYASNVYSPGLRVAKGTIGEKEQAFLDSVKRNLPMKIRAKMADIYFTDNFRVGSECSEPIIFRNITGKIKRGENRPKKSLFKKLKETTVNVFNQKPHDIALNLDNELIKKMISLSYRHDFSKNLAINTAVRLITEKFPVPVPTYNYSRYSGGYTSTNSNKINYWGY